MTIYSIGYGRLTLPELRSLAGRLGARIVDVRSKPYSRKAGFTKGALSEALGPAYLWRGDCLGGLAPGVTEAGLDWLRSQSAKGPLLLLCVEPAPGDCHRHHQIAVRLLPDPDVLHIFEQEVIPASELARAIRDGDDYEFDSLESVLESCSAAGS